MILEKIRHHIINRNKWFLEEEILEWDRYLWSLLKKSRGENKEYHFDVIVPYVLEHVFKETTAYTVNSMEELENSYKIFPHPIFKISLEDLPSNKEIMKGIKFLKLKKPKFEVEKFCAIPYLESTRGLDLSYNYWDKKEIEIFGKTRVLKNLIYLNLEACQVTNKKLKLILAPGNLRDLIYLRIGYNKITEMGLREVAKLQNLEGLNLSANNLSDEVLPHITQIKTLRFLDLRLNNITSKGALELAKNMRGTSLSCLDLGECLVDPCVEGKLRKTLPDCEFFF